MRFLLRSERILSHSFFLSWSKKVIDNDVTYSYECTDIVDLKTIDTLTMEEISADTFLLSRYALSDLVVANAFGIYHDLREYELLKIKIEREGESELLLSKLFKVSNHLNEGTDLAALEVQSVLDLIECTKLQLNKYRVRLSDANQDAQNKLSNWAIITGAATTMITASVLLSSNQELKEGSAFDWLAVAGGIATGYLALRSNQVDKRIKLSPTNNFVRIIYEGKDPDELFPRSTWYLLNQSFDVNNELITLREVVLREWDESSSMLGNPKNREYMPILISDEGIYTEDMIDLRIEMLESIKLGMDQIKRALYLFNAKRY